MRSALIHLSLSENMLDCVDSVSSDAVQKVEVRGD